MCSTLWSICICSYLVFKLFCTSLCLTQVNHFALEHICIQLVLFAPWFSTSGFTHSSLELQLTGSLALSGMSASSSLGGERRACAGWGRRWPLVWAANSRFNRRWQRDKKNKRVALVVGVGTCTASSLVMADLVSQGEETDSDTPTAHMRKFEKTWGVIWGQRGCALVL